jgi:selenocysteine-specific elongation factor
MILATAGHIDHGKTALVRALTGVDADRLPEEKRRGLTIDLGFAYASLSDGTELGFVDVPGHERFLPNMLAGVLSIDRVLLIVAADDGPRPQTLEHLDILELIGIVEVTGIVTKIDRVPLERRAAVEAELADLLAKAGYDGSPIFAVSSISGEGITALSERLSQSARAADAARAARRATGLFRMPIDRAFSLSGIGLVVTGTVAAGEASAGDRLTLSPRGAELRLRGIHAHNRPIERALAGERCALNLAGSFPEGGEPRRGDWVVAAPLHAPTSRVDLGLTVSRAAPSPLRDGLPVHVHLGTEDVVGRAAVLGARSIAPGESGFVQVDLGQAIGALWGDRVVLRDHGARHTLAGGRALDPFPPRRGRSRPERLAALAALAESDAGEALEGLLDTVGIVEFGRFGLIRNLPVAEIVSLVDAGGFDRFGSGDTAIALGAARLTRIGESLTAALGQSHIAQPDALGPSRAALFRRLRGEGPEAALDAALASLIATGRVVRDGAVLRLAEHEPRLTREDERLWQQVHPLLDADHLRPPRVRELAESLAMPPEPLTRFLRRATRFGRVMQVAPNRFFLPETVARLADLADALAAESPEGSFTAAQFKDRSGIGRNVTIEVLEYLDTIGVTRREGDTRVVLRRAAELFG